MTSDEKLRDHQYALGDMKCQHKFLGNLSISYIKLVWFSEVQATQL